MRRQQRFFSQPFHKTFRSSRPPRSDKRKKKRQKAIQAFRRSKTRGIQKAILEQMT